MKSLLRVMVLVTAFMLVGTWAMAFQHVLAYRATSTNATNEEIGTFFQGDPITITAWVDNYRDFAEWDLKVTVKGRGVYDKVRVAGEFDAADVWTISFDIENTQQNPLPEGVYVVTFQFKEWVRGAKWQKLICRFQVVESITTEAQAARAIGPVFKDSVTVRRLSNNQ